MAGEPNDKELIADAVEAIKGIDPNPQVALAKFVARYGEDALRDLVKKVNDGEFDTNKGVSEGMLNGVGDGMDDMIPQPWRDSKMWCYPMESLLYLRTLLADSVTAVRMRVRKLFTI